MSAAEKNSKPFFYLSIIYLNVFFYALFYQMQTPVLPFLVKELGANDSSDFSSMQSYFSIVQLFGGLASGPFGDHFGSKMILSLSNLASTLCYLLTASATSMAILNMSRVPTLFQHGMLGTRGMIALFTDPRERAIHLGYIMMAYGVGMAIGPAIGGVSAVFWGLKSAAWISALGSFACFLMVQIFLPSISESTVEEQETRSVPSSEEGREFSSRIIRVLTVPAVKRLLLIKFFIEISSRILHSTLPYILSRKSEFAASSQDLGYLLSYSGIIVSLSQALLIGPISSRFQSDEIIISCSAVLSLAFIAISQTYSLTHIWIAFIPFLVVGTIFSTINTSQLSKAVSFTDVGTVLSLDMSVGSLVGIFSPHLGMSIFQSFGFEYLGLACASLAALATITSITTSKITSTRKKIPHKPSKSQ